MGEHSIEVVGEKLRAMMPWIKANKLVDQIRATEAARCRPSARRLSTAGVADRGCRADRA